MNREEIVNKKKQIQSCFNEQKYLKTYDIIKQLLNIENKKCLVNYDLYYLYIYASNCTSYLNNHDLSLEYAQKAEKYASKESEKITVYNLLAFNHILAKNTDEAIISCDKCIQMCDQLLETFDICFVKQRDRINLDKADAMHNKGELIENIGLILDSISIYKELLLSQSLNKEVIKTKINNAYKTLNKIPQSETYITKATTP